MKYILWHSCYIDLLKSEGVGSYFLENESGSIRHGFVYKSNTTINQLALAAVEEGLSEVLKTCEEHHVHIVGVNKYLDTVVERAVDWMEQEVLDQKAHSELVRNIALRLAALSGFSTKYFTSRRSDPMLWTTSLWSKHDFRLVQDETVEKLKAVSDGTIYSYASQKDRNLLSVIKLKNPMTELQLEKKILAKRTEVQGPGDDNVIRLPLRRI